MPKGVVVGTALKLETDKPESNCQTEAVEVSNLGMNELSG